MFSGNFFIVKLENLDIIGVWTMVLGLFRVSGVKIIKYSLLIP